MFSFVSRQTLETDLKIEREWRGTLQKNLDQEKSKLSKLQAELQHLMDVKRVNLKRISSYILVQ